MNKIQLIKCLILRGVTELNNETSADALRRTGGDPTQEEMVKINKLAMDHYIDECLEQNKINEQLQETMNRLKERNEELEKRDNFLLCLEAAGVNNWDGYGIAKEAMEENE